MPDKIVLTIEGSDILLTVNGATAYDNTPGGGPVDPGPGPTPTPAGTLPWENAKSVIVTGDQNGLATLKIGAPPSPPGGDSAVFTGVYWTGIKPAFVTATWNRPGTAPIVAKGSSAPNSDFGMDPGYVQGESTMSFLFTDRDGGVPVPGGQVKWTINTGQG